MPMPVNLYYWWNFGSLLGSCLVIQLVSGIFLSMYYENNMDSTFDSINQIERNINLGWELRSIHANGASLFFILIYLHIGRGLYYKSFSLQYVWISGCFILLLLFMTAFIGYVLPWGQMSFWGATVITNLLTSIPYAGKMMTVWLWGNFSISKSTLMRFFSIHFILPFIMVMFVVLHIIFLHKSGSSNPLGIRSDMDKIPFQPYFTWKDLLGLFVLLLFFMSLVLLFPSFFMDPDNYVKANSLVTPPHIQPEWYFLFAYAILRVVPNKLGGVIALLFSIFVLFMLPTIISLTKFYYFNNFHFKMVYKVIFFFWFNNFLYLTLMGSMPIEQPFIDLSSGVSVNYFFFYLFYL